MAFNAASDVSDEALMVLYANGDRPAALALTLRITSDVAFAVVFDELDEAFCVEPQSGPPDGPNASPLMVWPGEPLVASTRWAWG